MITSDMCKWLDENINLEGSVMTPEEQITGIDWQYRFQDFTDNGLKNYFVRNEDRRWPWVLHDLSEKAIKIGNSHMEDHLNHIEDRDAFLNHFKELQEKCK